MSEKDKKKVVVQCWAEMLSINDTQIMAIEDFQQSLNISCFRGINVKCLLTSWKNIEVAKGKD